VRSNSCKKKKKKKSGRGRGRPLAEGLTKAAASPLLTKSARYQQHLMHALLELGIKSSPTPGSDNFHLLNELKTDIIVLFELQRVYAEQLYQVQVLKEQKNLLKAKQEGTGSSGLEEVASVPYVNSIHEEKSEMIEPNEVEEENLQYAHPDQDENNVEREDIRAEIIME